MTILIRKYYNQPVAFHHRRIWPQKEKQKRELRVESLQNPNQDLRQNQSQDLRKSQNPKERISHLAGTQLAFLAEQKLLKKFLAKAPLLQVK
jgi:hypothetical protein